LPDDSREADEKESERRLRDLRARVKVARSVVSTTPGVATVIATDWRKAAGFYARFGITETQFRHGVLATCPEDADTCQSSPSVLSEIERFSVREPASMPD